MPDITMCVNKECPLAETCKRFKSTTNEFQSMALFEYKITKYGVECEYHIPINK